MFWRDHKLEAYTAYIRLYLISHFFTQLLCLLIAIFPKWITDLLDEISGVIFHPLLNIHFLPDFFSFSLLVPAPPFFFMLPDFLIIHQYKLLIDSNNDESSQSKQSLIVSQYFSDGRAWGWGASCSFESSTGLEKTQAEGIKSYHQEWGAEEIVAEWS